MNKAWFPFHNHSTLGHRQNCFVTTITGSDYDILSTLDHINRPWADLTLQGSWRCVASSATSWLCLVPKTCSELRQTLSHMRFLDVAGNPSRREHFLTAREDRFICIATVSCFCTLKARDHCFQILWKRALIKAEKRAPCMQHTRSAFAQRNL